VAGVLTRAGARATWDTASTLIGIRRSLARNSPAGSATVTALRVLGVLLGAGTLLLGLVRFDEPGRWVDLFAAVFLAG
jgi:hypothetical protein